MIIQRQFSIFGFSKIGLLDFFKLVNDCKYPNVSENLGENTVGWESTYNVIPKISSKQSKRVKEVLANLEKELEDIIKKNNLGSVDNWKLYVVYLEKVKDKLMISFGLECVKPIGKFKKGNAFSCSINLD
jgi:hypothetical protein